MRWFKMMKFRRIAVYMGILLWGTLFFVGCNTEPSPTPKEQTGVIDLEGLLPQETGYFWIYSGFADYGHNMRFVSKDKQEKESTYHFTGVVDDLSDDETKADYSIAGEYIIKEQALVQKLKAEKMMDTFTEIELLRLPLEKDAKWEQTVLDKKGKEYQLTCTISEIEEKEDGRVYTVQYQDKNSKFYEKRQIKEKQGVISFEKLWMGDNKESMVIGYHLYADASGPKEKTDLLSFLPPLNTRLNYHGLAEYAHVGQLEKVSENEKQQVYQFEGSFSDGSGIPGNFQIQYVFDYDKGTVVEKVLKNTREKKKEVNSKLREPIIIKSPLIVGNSWEQTVQFDGSKKTMKAQIVRMEYEGKTFYTQMKNRQLVMTVRYMVEDVPGYFMNTYVEERRFEKGLGMIGFSQLMKGDIEVKDEKDVYEVEQALINKMFGYRLNRF